jgi:arylsulfatase A-like enzyme
MAVLCCVQDKAPLNIVLIGVDTLRRDHVGCYGYDRNTTPNVDRLAREGILFENAISQSPWTLPSFATVLTSLYPAQHGGINSRSPIREPLPTLASILRENGYRTGAIINAPYLEKKYKLTQGFDGYRMPPRTGRDADDTTIDALKWIDRKPDKPFFIFVHYFDPHIPYAPPAPYDTIFDPHYRGEIEAAYNPRKLPHFRNTGFKGMRSLKPEDWNHIRSLYDGEIAFTDQAIGDLLQGLEERALIRNTLIVFLSDHGEEFFDHQGFEHGHTLYSELIAVPFIVSLPTRLPGGVRLSQQVRLLDVAPTILDLAGINTPRGFEGISFKRLIEGTGGPDASGGSLLPPQIAYSEALLYLGERKSLTAYPWKLIYDVETGERMFYNLAEDPSEVLNLAGEPSESMDLLEETLFRTLFSVSDTWFVEIAGGEYPHRFDIEARCNVAPRSAKFELHKVFDSQNAIIATEEVGETRITKSRVAIRGLEVTEPLTLALKLDRRDAQVTFDFAMDGRPATTHTYIGEALLQPVTMPFTEQRPNQEQRRTSTLGRRPDPPYLMVWCYDPGYGGGVEMELDEETREKLRALGYIQ